MDALPAYELENRLGYFDQMISEMVSGQFRRTTFQPWEVEVLLDIQACHIAESNRKEILRRYQKASHRWFERGGRTMLLLSDYLAKRHRKGPINGDFAPALGPEDDEPDEIS
jgi:hypothetical protein